MTLFKDIGLLVKTAKAEEPLSRHTSFRIGGPAEVMVWPESFKELEDVRDMCKNRGIPLTVLGDGTNVLAPDAGLRGVVLSTNRLNTITFLQDNKVSAQAGAKTGKLANLTAKAGLQGLAFAAGIPGTIGGAVYMNAGAYGGEMKDVCESVSLLTDEGILEKTASEMGFGYRTSIAQQGGMLVLGAVFALSPGVPKQIREEIIEFNKRRRNTQPVEFPSAGSAFKRPEGYFVGKLVQDSGLRGFSVGGAMVSEKHTGFIINTGGATAKDVLELIEAVRARVNELFGVMLEPEVRLLGGL